ncbi:GAF and ANTAR domain-containing protein [Plantactinospora sp. GCM10030261]|uniref:GAF and ANTAR domain-containing protein n=1 Tax=Plantactinospora sp. GCM10030261 TaxID=3273420 RepID=UPI00361260A5
MAEQGGARERGTPSDSFTAQADKPDWLAVRLGELARSLQDLDDARTTLVGIVRAAVETIPGAQHAGIMEVRQRRKLVTSAASSDLVRRVDRAQYDVGEGPCLSALYDHRTVRMADVDTERRWPRFTRRAAALGVGSMLSCQLYLVRDDLGALNLYAEEPHAFTDESEHIALLFAAHAAVAMADALRLDQMSRALDIRDVIGQAKGILMERYRLTDQRAFAVLMRTSQNENVKLVDVARHLVETRELLGRGEPTGQSGG